MDVVVAEPRAPLSHSTNVHVAPIGLLVVAYPFAFSLLLCMYACTQHSNGINYMFSS